AGLWVTGISDPLQMAKIRSVKDTSHTLFYQTAPMPASRCVVCQSYCAAVTSNFGLHGVQLWLARRLTLTCTVGNFGLHCFAVLGCTGGRPALVLTRRSVTFNFGLQYVQFWGALDATLGCTDLRFCVALVHK